MTLNTDKYLVPDGAPSGGRQPMKSVSFGEIAGKLQNPNLIFPDTDGTDGFVITTDGQGNLTLKQIPRAGSVSFRCSTTTSAPPSSGQIRWNNSTQNIATKLYMSYTDEGGSDISAYLQSSIVAGNRLTLQKTDDQSIFQIWDVVAATDQGTYLEVDVQLDSSGGGNVPNNSSTTTVISSGTAQSSSFNTLSSGAVITGVSIAARYFGCDASGGAFTLTLPLAAGVEGLSYIFTKTDGTVFPVTIQGNGGELIGGDASVSLSGLQDTFILVSNGTGWVVLSRETRTVAFLADRDGVAQQSIPSGVSTLVQNSVEKIDIGGYYDNTTFQWVPQAGTYFIQGHVRIIGLDNGDELIVRLLKNGTPIYFDNSFSSMNNQDPSAGAAGLTSANGTDVYTMEVEHNQGSNLNISSGPDETYFYGYRIG
jgi:hypothetical protein